MPSPAVSESNMGTGLILAQRTMTRALQGMNCTGRIELPVLGHGQAVSVTWGSVEISPHSGGSNILQEPPDHL